MNAAAAFLICILPHGQYVVDASTISAFGDVLHGHDLVSMRERSVTPTEARDKCIPVRSGAGNHVLEKLNGGASCSFEGERGGYVEFRCVTTTEYD